MAYDPNAFGGRARSSPRQIDMTLEGDFRQPTRSGGTFALRLGGIAAVVAILAAGIGVAALALWVAIAVIPIALGAALIAYIAFRYQMWRARSGRGLRRM